MNRYNTSREIQTHHVFIHEGCRALGGMVVVVVVVVKPRGRTKERYSVIAVRNREREAFL